MEPGVSNAAERGQRRGERGVVCVLCGKRAGERGGFIVRPRDRRQAGVRCGWCYRRYLRNYFPEVVV